MNKWNNLKRLWPHQIKAVRTVERYVNQQNGTNGPAAALVQMPTGTGKTGVISVSASCLRRAHRVLLVCPSEALRDQLAHDLERGFWENAVEVPAKDWAKPVRIVTPTRFASTPNAWFDQHGVLVSTFQTLQQIHAEWPDEFERLRNGIDF